MDQKFQSLVTAIERITALFLALITALTFVAVFLRYIVGYVIPDSFDIARLMLGVSIFWGIAAANYRDEHIGMDLVWSMVGSRARWAIDAIAGVVTLAVFLVFFWMFTFKVLDAFRSRETTFDLHLPIWLFYGLAWLGVLAGAFLLAVRVWQTISRQSGIPEKGEKPVMD